MRYTWTIKTGDVWYAGTDANVFLSLNGLDAVMKEVQISDPKALNDWEKGDTNSGTIETEDLGELQTGLLRSDQSAPGAGWFVDWIKVRNEEDGREWTAQIGAWSDHDGRDGRFRLRFALTDPGDYERIQKAKQASAQKQAEKDVAAKRQREEDERKQRESQADTDFDQELDAANKQLERDLKKARLEAELAKKRAEIEKLKNPGGTPTPTPYGGSSGGLRTLELFGVLNGSTVPLAQVVACDRVTGSCSVVPVGRVLVGDQPGDGFGMAGMPGRWQQFYPGRSPAEFGLDADKDKGMRFRISTSGVLGAHNAICTVTFGNEFRDESGPFQPVVLVNGDLPFYAVNITSQSFVLKSTQSLANALSYDFCATTVRSTGP